MFPRRQRLLRQRAIAYSTLLRKRGVERRAAVAERFQKLVAVLAAAENAKIPVYGSEEEQVKNGCAASMSIDYVALGKLTGGLAVKVMRGTPAEELAVEKLSEALPVINEAALGAVGISVPAEYAGATRVG